MSGRLTTIAAELADLLGTITEANGYGYNFGSVNEIDGAHRVEPSAEITYAQEDPVSEASGYYGFAAAQFEIRLRGSLSAIPDAPFYKIDAELDTILRDVKQVLLRASTPNTLPLSIETVIQYNGFTKETDTNGDMFRPKSLLTKWTVKYQEELTSQSS